VNYLTSFLKAMGVAVMLIVAVGQTVSVIPSYFYQSLAMLIIGTSGLYYYLQRVKKKQPDFFVHFYLASIAVKLLSYGAYLALIIWKDRPGAQANVVFFISVYALFTALEVGFLWRQVNR
jgi:ABC-type uncharacterized transport system permease subunit